jgi:hypothetical protein
MHSRAFKWMTIDEVTAFPTVSVITKHDFLEHLMADGHNLAKFKTKNIEFELKDDLRPNKNGDGGQISKNIFFFNRAHTRQFFLI